MTEQKLEQTQQQREPFFNREIPLWKAASITLVTLVVAVVILTVIGQQFFWRPAITTPQQRGLAYYQALVDREPNKPENWVDLGWYYYLNGEYEQALSKHLHALELDPEHEAANYNAGLTFLQLDNNHGAVEYLNKSIEINDQFWEAYLTLGVAYIGLEQWFEAEEALHSSLAIHYFSADTYFYLGYVAERQGQMEAALEMYEEALRFDPEYSEARAGLSRVQQES